MHPKTQLLIGPPASGKTTLGSLLAEETGGFHCSMGSLFRDAKDGRLPFSTKEYAHLGKLYQSPKRRGQAGIYLLKTYLQHAYRKGEFSVDEQTLILDGFPRYGSQAGFLQSGLELQGVTSLQCDPVIARAREQYRATTQQREMTSKKQWRQRWDQYEHQCALLHSCRVPQHISVDASKSLEVLVATIQDAWMKSISPVRAPAVHQPRPSRMPGSDR